MNRNGSMNYFPLHSIPGREERLIKRDFGMTGTGILVEIYRRIHGELGYYCRWNYEGVARQFVEETGSRAVPEVVRACIRLGIFSKDLYEKYGILTSATCQRVYFDAFKGRSKVFIKKEYLCLSIPSLPKNAVFEDEISVISKKAGRSATRKNEPYITNIGVLTNYSENKEALSHLQLLFDEAGLKIECDMIIEEAFAKRMIVEINEKSPWVKIPSEGRPLSWWYSPPLKGGDKRNKIDILMSGGYREFPENKKKAAPAHTFAQHEYTKEELKENFESMLFKM